MILVVIFILLINSNVYADDMCTRLNINRLKENAKNVEVTYEHNLYNDVDLNNTLISIYDVMISGITNEMYVVDDEGNNYYYGMMEDNLLSIKLSSGYRRIYIYSLNCEGIILDTIVLYLPKFNFNSLNEECKMEEFRDLDICSEFLSDNEDAISDEEFKEIIEVEKRKNEDFVSKVKRYVLENKILVIIGGFVLFLIIVLLLYMRYRRRGRLE